MRIVYDDRFAHFFGICRYAPDGEGEGSGEGGSGEGGGAGGAGGAGAGAGGETDWKAEAEKWKGLSRKHEATAKQNSDAAAKLADIENSNKSELEKATAAREASDKEASDARSELLRYRVAMKKGLTEAQAKRLVGTTEEELEADADELLDTFKPASNGDPDRESRSRPRETLRPGSTPYQEKGPSPKDIVDKVMAESL